MDALSLIHHIPILTTILSAVFSIRIIQRYRAKTQSTYLLWWGIGVAIYGLGTLIESYNTLFGWNVVAFKSWYISGALLGGAPLAIGTIYLLVGRKAGHIAVALLFLTTAITSVLVILSPINYTLVNPSVFNSKVLEWQGIRKVSPFINGSAALFLIGGAFYSAIKYLRRDGGRNRFVGNLLIAAGAILPGIGGGFSRAGYTEVLYIGEFLGIILIWYGYQYCQRPAPQPASAKPFAVLDSEL